MKRLHQLCELAGLGRVVLAMGFFDGVHLGHRAILSRAAELAEETRALSCVMTFSPHPAAVLFPERQPELLETEEEKERVFASLGMAAAVVLSPTREFLAEPKEAFAAELAALPELTGLVCGENFTFGAGAEGTPEFLADYFRESAVSVSVLPLMRSGALAGGVISSSAIRRLLRAGDVAAAAGLLGRRYALTGDVAHGFARGAEALGFPTANLVFGAGRILPADGVYASFAVIRGRRYRAVTNVGTNPTFGGRQRTVETFVLDFDESIYGEPFTIEFAARLRGEICFESIEALKAQIACDVESAKRLLSEMK